MACFENIHVTNRSYDKVVRVVNNNPPSNNNIKGHRNVEDMVIAMERPRTVMTVLPSGKTTDDIVTKLWDTLDEGDTVIDLANDHYTNSEWRDNMLNSRNINYLGLRNIRRVRGRWRVLR